ncbi:hypothetical protein FPRO04_07706 [Fusarium proliferatum]|nr:hypothetical protein FPRO03_06666 [Fusarium proliferatum]KAG4276960.1 hypothetical protein FPRO04_07706 [Fusarium proliferatum]
MAFLFQPPIFGNYILPVVPMNVPTTPVALPQLTIAPVQLDGPVSPPDLVKKVSFGDMTAPDFHKLMIDTAINNYGAFILVDHGYVPIKILAQQTDNDQSTPPNGSSNGTTDNSQNNSTGNTQPSPSSTSSTDAINTNAPEPSNAGDNTTVPEPAASEINTAPVATNSQPGSKMPKVASVEPGDTGE